MIFLDTNLLVYSTVKSIDENRYNTSTAVIKESIKEDVSLSPLIINEYIYVLSRFKEITSEIMSKGFETFINYVDHVIDKEIVSSAFILSSKIKLEKSKNDIIHLKYAEKYCDKLITFDKGFKRLISYTNIEIQILE